MDDTKNIQDANWDEINRKIADKIGCRVSKDLHNFCWFWFNPLRYCTKMSGPPVISPARCPTDSDGGGNVAAKASKNHGGNIQADTSLF